jgi:hypothetical protein
MEKDSVFTVLYEWKLNSKVLEIEKRYDNNLLRQRFKSSLLILGIACMAIVVIMILLHLIRLRRVEYKKMELELNYNKTKSTLALYERRIAELETDKKSKTKELSLLKEKTEELTNQIRKNLQQGQQLFEKLENGVSPINWPDNDLFCLFDFVETYHYEFFIHIENDYRGLNASQKLFLIVDELLKKNDYEICQMFGLEKHSLYNKRARIEKRQLKNCATA